MLHLVCHSAIKAPPKHKKGGSSAAGRNRLLNYDVKMFCDDYGFSPSRDMDGEKPGHGNFKGLMISSINSLRDENHVWALPPPIVVHDVLPHPIRTA